MNNKAKLTPLSGLVILVSGSIDIYYEFNLYGGPAFNQYELCNSG